MTNKVSGAGLCESMRYGPLCDLEKLVYRQHQRGAVARYQMYRTLICLGASAVQFAQYGFEPDRSAVYG